MYADGMLRMAPVWGVPMNAMSPSYYTAKNFMNSNGCWCCSTLSASIIGFIFELIVYQKFKTLELNTSYIPKDFREKMKLFFDYHAENVWLHGLLYLVFMCCISAVVILVARHCLSMRNLRSCCICEGCWSICEFCGGLFLTALMIWFFWLASNSDPTYVCDSAGSIVHLSNGFTSVMPTTTGNPTDIHYIACKESVQIARDVVLLMGFNMLVLACCTYISACACASGAKYADHTQAIFDMEEFGDDPYGFESQGYMM
mmetsp:Transcript_94352/g.149206  ORF Transcript_94352/g.149206 Transcript_94352/m.149206 type:complete len:258 (+) Transcript_94352:53-826(+)